MKTNDPSPDSASAKTPEPWMRKAVKDAATTLHEAYTSDYKNDGTYVLNLDDSWTVTFFASVERIMLAYLTRNAPQPAHAPQPAKAGETSRTDAACPVPSGLVSADFARQLERELNATAGLAERVKELELSNQTYSTQAYELFMVERQRDAAQAKVGEMERALEIITSDRNSLIQVSDKHRDIIATLEAEVARLKQHKDAILNSGCELQKKYDALRAQLAPPAHGSVELAIRTEFKKQFGEHANDKAWRHKQSGMNAALFAIRALTPAESSTKGNDEK